MGHSTLLHVNYSGLTPFNASGTSLNQFGIYTGSPNTGEYVSGTSNKLVFHGNENPWVYFHMNNDDTYTDITLDIQSMIMGGGSQIFINFRSDITSYPRGYQLVLSESAGALEWRKQDPYSGWIPTAKYILYSFSTPCKLRIKFEGEVMSVWINDVFVDSCDYTGFQPTWIYPKGRTMLTQYGSNDFQFNSILYKGDRLDNITI